MEFRMKYRDIPWSVAIGVLPGKIVGTLFIKPWIRLKRNNGRVAIVWLRRLCVLLLALVILAVIFTLIDQLTHGAVGGSMDRAWDWWVSVIVVTPAVPTIPTPTEIGLR
jgi:hypothetical protein